MSLPLLTLAEYPLRLVTVYDEFPSAEEAFVLSLPTAEEVVVEVVVRVVVCVFFLFLLEEK
jgi:hypothetical protein